MLSKRLYDLLLDVRVCSGDRFSGVGVLVSADPAALPIIPLRPQSRFYSSPDVRVALIAISDEANEFHDGFHVLTPDLDIMLVSQYFSPPIVADLRPDPARRLGGRYMAAMFGSTLPGVLAAGVASANYGVAVFEQGHGVGLTR